MKTGTHTDINGARRFARVFALLSALVCCLALLAGCSEDPLPEGAIATVNGSPIMLRQVEAQHDVTSMSWFSVRAPSVEQLKSQYGDALFHLIVQELISQALERQGNAVTQAELEEVERRVRADYPNDEFEKALVEDYLDLELWRGMMRYTLNQEKFQRFVLRSSISISAEEVQSYYDRHNAGFVMPARLHFFLLTSLEPEPVEQARLAIAAGTPIRELAARMPDLFVQELQLEPERLFPAWAAALNKLKPGEISPVLDIENDYQCVVLVESLPAAQLSLARAYPQIERILVEEKIGAVFLDWLEKELNTADIRVSPHLLLVAEERAALQAEEENTPPEPQPDMDEAQSAPANIAEDEGI